MSTHCGVCLKSLRYEDSEKLCCRVCATMMHRKCAEMMELDDSSSQKNNTSSELMSSPLLSFNLSQDTIQQNETSDDLSFQLNVSEKTFLQTKLARTKQVKIKSTNDTIVGKIGIKDEEPSNNSNYDIVYSCHKCVCV